jgi:hypothetical protein
MPKDYGWQVVNIGQIYTVGEVCTAVAAPDIRAVCASIPSNFGRFNLPY